MKINTWSGGPKAAKKESTAGSACASPEEGDKELSCLERYCYGYDMNLRCLNSDNYGAFPSLTERFALRLIKADIMRRVRQIKCEDTLSN